MIGNFKAVEKSIKDEEAINPFVLADSELAITEKNISRIAVINQNLKKNNEMLEAAKEKFEEEHLKLKAAYDEVVKRIAKNNATITALEEIFKKEFDN